MMQESREIKLEDLGYSSFFENSRNSSSSRNLSPARIIAEHKESYILKNERSDFSAKVTGKMMFSATTREDYPAVGDWVLVNLINVGQAVIHEILPRKTVLARKSAGKSDSQIIAANIDTAFVIQSPDRDYNLNRFERYFSIATTEGITPKLVLNKTDLLSETELEIIMSELHERFKDIPIYATSTIAGSGIADLKTSIRNGTTYCFLGSSGVGKSSIINILIGKDMIKTGEISFRTNRGKHVTTHRELFILETGGLLIDNPGMREVGLVDSEQGINTIFSEIDELSTNCKFLDCAHIHEPGCAILQAIESGDFDEEKYNNYIKLSKENEYNTMSKFVKREKDRQFGKFIKNAKKQDEKYNR